MVVNAGFEFCDSSTINLQNWLNIRFHFYIFVTIFFLYLLFLKEDVKELLNKNLSHLRWEQLTISIWTD